MKTPVTLQKRSLSWGLADIARAAEISELEAASYPADEAATLAQIRMRIQARDEAGQYFVCVHDSGQLVGFVNGTCAEGETLEHETMSTHNPSGTTLCIHSVCVAPDRRRQGIATLMLRAYVKHIAETHKHLERILLLSKAYLLTFYMDCGFKLIRVSPVVHGSDTWFELGLDLRDARAHDILQIDAFAGQAFRGNPAAVVFTQQDGDEGWMQSVANENNLSETAFLEEMVEPGHFQLRWFTPSTEVDLCGHATLASAFALYSTKRVAPECQIHFHTKSGVLLASQAPDGLIELDFPATPATEETTPYDEELMTLVTTGLGVSRGDVEWIGRSKFDLVVVVSLHAFKQLKPNFGILGKIDARGVAVTACSHGDNGDGRFGEGVDYVCRFFGPQVGVDEDPVTGSAHCTLVPLWAQRLSTDSLVGYQASQRGGIVTSRLCNERVKLRGSAVTTIVGKLYC